MMLIMMTLDCKSPDCCDCRRGATDTGRGGNRGRRRRRRSVFQSKCSTHGEFSIARISIVLSRFQHRTISSTFIWYVSICRLSAYSMIGRPLLRRQRQSTSGGTVAVSTSARRALFSLPLARDITRTHMRASLFRARGMPHTLHSVAHRR